MPPKKRSKVYQRTFIGCWTCRRRKIKCDATRPHCLRCAKSKLECEGYDVKLNWSTPLVVKNGEMIFNDDENELDEPPVTFQRSNIALCKWNIYNYYEDIDDDLENLESLENNAKIGPFTVFRYKSISQSSSPILIQSIPQSRSTSFIPTTSPIRSKTPTRIPTRQQQHHLIHQSLIKFAKISIIAKGLDESTPLLFPLPSIASTSINIDPNRVLQPLTKNIDNSIMITSYFKLSINHFMTLIPQIFHNKKPDFINYIQSTIQTSLGQFILHNNDQDLQLLLNVTTVSLLHKLDLNNLSSLTEITQLFKMTSHLPITTNSDSTTLSLILQIMIATTLGIYNPLFFKQSPILQSPISSIYKYLKLSNILLNPSQFEMDPKYSKIYEDLNQSYNLLKNIKTKPKQKDLKNGYGMILIQSKETPRDQIIKVPKYIEDDDEGPPPPSFVVNFSHAEDESSEDDDESSEESLDDDHHQQSMTLFNLDDVPDLLKESSFGVSNCLIFIFEELVKLINHKRIFNFLKITSRNFPKVCADFEDILHKSNDLIIDSKCHNDLKFYNCLVLLYYKLVMNYPSHLLNYHFNALKNINPDVDLGLIWFVKHALDGHSSKNVELGQFDKVWLNNWESKQLIYELKLKNNNGDWANLMNLEKFNDFFVL